MGGSPPWFRLRFGVWMDNGRDLADRRQQAACSSSLRWFSIRPISRTLKRAEWNPPPVQVRIDSASLSVVTYATRSPGNW